MPHWACTVSRQARAVVDGPSLQMSDDRGGKLEPGMVAGDIRVGPAAEVKWSSVDVDWLAPRQVLALGGRAYDGAGDSPTARCHHRLAAANARSAHAARRAGWRVVGCCGSGGGGGVAVGVIVWAAGQSPRGCLPGRRRWRKAVLPGVSPGLLSGCRWCAGRGPGSAGCWLPGRGAAQPASGGRHDHPVVRATRRLGVAAG
jgi:hypothetical protein